MLKIIASGIAALFVLASVSVADATFSGEGVVNAIKSKEQKLTITHGPIAGLMEGMTMDFAVMDPLMLNEVKAGSKIKFTLSKDSRGNLLVTDLEQVTTTSVKK